MQQNHKLNCVCGLPCTGNVIFGIKCGCFFHWRCIENINIGCPNHGVAFPLAYTKHNCFCAGCSATGNKKIHQNRVKLCTSCGETILERIVSLIKDEAGYKYSHLFQKLFCSEMGLWPDIVNSAARDEQYEHNEDGTLCTTTGSAIYPLLHDAWLAILELMSSSARITFVTTSPSAIWYTPQLLHYELSSLPIDVYPFDTLALRARIPKQQWEDAEGEFRVWIRGKGSKMVIATPGKMYRIYTKYNIVSKKAMLSTIQRCGVTGARQEDLWGEHPFSFQWLKELEAEGHTYFFGQLVVATSACSSISGLKLQPQVIQNQLYLKVNCS